MATSTCKSCGASIIWLETPQGKKMPVDTKPEKRVIMGTHTGLAHVLDAYMPHWATCPKADLHRRMS